MKADFETLAAYHQWANRRLYAACAPLSAADLHADLGAFFSSLAGTLNHLLIADALWLARLRRQTPPEAVLDAQPYQTLDQMRPVRQSLDEEIRALTQDLTEADLANDLTVSLITLGRTITHPMSLCLTHFFNHQTHHRGQCHAMLTRLTGEAPPMDLIFFLEGA